MMSARALPALAGLCLGLVACGGTGAGTSSIRPFSAIEVGKPRIEVAADGTSAVVQIETDPPSVCAIAYGKTASLGSIANDPDMDGTAIPHHIVALSGLAPGTSYRFRLTATDAQGLVFQTQKLGTFTTPRQAVGHQRDVALGAKVLAVSSQWSYAYRAANAVDGNLSTEWASNGDGNRAWVTIDLGRPYKVNGIAFLTRAMADGTAITKTFAVVVDGRRRYGPFPAGNLVSPRVAPVSFVARRLRFEVVTSTGGNTGAAEIEVFSPS
jgi:hypothetical protein